MIDFKEGIAKNFERCVEFLDDFDKAQIDAIYDYISSINQTSVNYEMMSSPSRTAILLYLVQLKTNEKKYDEYLISNKMYSIMTTMGAMGLLRLKYMKYGKTTEETKDE